MHIVAFTGIRDLDPDSEPDVELAVLEHAHGTVAMHFGGARGADTVALRAACALPLDRVVILPSTLANAPREAAPTIRECATSVVEMRLPPQDRRSYLRRDDAMVAEATELVAFTDGRRTGGTAYTIAAARRRGIPVDVVPVGASVARPNPQLQFPTAPAPIHGMVPYLSEQRGPSLASEFVRYSKADIYVEELAVSVEYDLAQYIRTHPELGAVRVLVPVPRRRPGAPNDLALVTERVAARLGIAFDLDWLRRVAEPRESELLIGRLRSPAEAHAVSFAVRPGADPQGVLLLDNVITTGGTMIGAQLAARRDTGVAPPGLALTYAKNVRVVRGSSRPAAP